MTRPVVPEARQVLPQDVRGDVVAAHDVPLLQHVQVVGQVGRSKPDARTPLPGLYLVGAGTHPGAGVPGVVNSAKATAAIIQTD